MRLTAKNIDNNITTAKQGNAEEQPDASCGYNGGKRWQKMLSLFILPGILQRKNLGSMRAAPSSAVRLKICLQTRLRIVDTLSPSHVPALSIFLRFLRHSYRLLCGWNHQSGKLPWIS